MTFLNFLLHVAAIIAILANLPHVPFIKSLLPAPPSPPRHILFPEPDEEDSDPSNRPGRGERDLIAVTYAAVINEGKGDAKGVMGLSFGKGYPVFGGGWNMGEELPEEWEQSEIAAAILAISRTLSFAPWSYDLYIVTNCPLAIHLLNTARQELKATPNGSAAWPASLDPKDDEPCYGGTMRGILQAIWCRALKRDTVRAGAMGWVDMVEEGKHLKKAKRLAKSYFTDKLEEEDREDRWMEDEDGEESDNSSTCSCGCPPKGGDPELRRQYLEAVPCHQRRCSP